MKRYIVPIIFCAVGAMAIFCLLFLSELNITLGDLLISGGIAVVITSILLLLVILAFYMKKTDNMFKLQFYRVLEFLSVFLFILCGLASLLILNHCFTVWQRTGEIKENLNIRQLGKMLPEYEDYANQRIANYENQLDEAILYWNARTQELSNLGFSTDELLDRQKSRKIEKLKQVLRPHTYKNLTDTINASITKFIGIVEEFSPITAPKNIIRIEEWAKYYENQLKNFSHYKMKVENAEDFQFESTFGNVEEILTKWNEDFFSSERFLGYSVGIIALIFMMFPYFKVRRSNKWNY